MSEPITFLTRNPKVLRSVRLNRFLSRESRLKFLQAFFLLTLFSLVIMVFAWLAASKVDAIRGIITSRSLTLRALGLFMCFGFTAWFFAMLEFYFLANAQSQPFIRTTTKGSEAMFKLDYEGAIYLRQLRALKIEQIELNRLYEYLLQSNFVAMLLLRIGITQEDFTAFIAKRKGTPVMSQGQFFETLVLGAHETGSDTISAREFLLLLHDADKPFADFLFERRLHKKELIGAAGWVSAEFEADRMRARWWEKQSLARVPAIGRALSYGYTYTLDRYSRDIPMSSAKKSAMHSAIHKDAIQQFEEVLSRSGQTNVLLVGETGSGKETILEDIARMIEDGTVLPALKNKRLLEFDTVSLIAATKTKGALEELTIKVMNEAVSAGNIVMVIHNVADFLQSGLSIGVNFVTLLEPYLEGAVVQVVGTDEPTTFHQHLEPNPALMKLFEKVEVPTPDADRTLYVLEDIALDLEKINRVFITYPALIATAEMADRYIVQSAMPEKAIDLLERAVTLTANARKTFVEAEDVQHAVEQETHILVTEPGGEESQKLLNLEEILHKRIIGQDEAVKAVADALRKMRSGLHDGKRPIGSFLFLGPTGVGKTETAKALAEVYFGSEDAMVRFDMSEFQGPEGMEKLIGSYATKEQGLLSNALRTKPFCLLLFDEFEKSSLEVINLFLQILEEGFFTDATGKHVSTRETMIIATSNAGANLIWEMVQKGTDPATMQKEVIDAIRAQGVFSPEILNRFDSLVVFHPLGQEHLKDVARLLLEGFAKDLQEKDIEFVVTRSLVDKIAQIGYDPVMGARPMRRAITDRVEQTIAKRLLDGSVKRGAKVEFTMDEISKL